jgi:hypothetical protein
MLEMNYCIAIIQSGPRRGQACGRTCYGSEYCTQYHRRIYEPVEEKKYNYGTVVRLPEPSIPRQSVHRQIINWIQIVNRQQLRSVQTSHITSDQKRLQILQLNKLLPTKPKKRSWFKKLFSCMCVDDVDPVSNPLNLPKIVHKDDCTICTCEPESDEVWSTMSCQHSFHTECIVGWMETFGSKDKGCPLCRGNIIGCVDKSFLAE